MIPAVDGSMTIRFVCDQLSITKDFIDETYTVRTADGNRRRGQQNLGTADGGLPIETTSGQEINRIDRHHIDDVVLLTRPEVHDAVWRLDETSGAAAAAAVTAATFARIAVVEGNGK